MCIRDSSLDVHYGKLYRAYVDRFNKGEGDPDFNEAGAFLHSIYFPQFQPPASNNKPTGRSLAFIEKHFKTFDRFKQEFLKTAMTIQGSGWIYLAKNGELKKIKNHEIKQDIVLLIDWWEHAFILDFGTDKEKYLNAQWNIINWSMIDAKIPGSFD